MERFAGGYANKSGAQCGCQGCHPGLGVSSTHAVTINRHSACRRVHREKRAVGQGQRLGEHQHVVAGTEEPPKETERRTRTD